MEPLKTTLKLEVGKWYWIPYAYGYICRECLAVVSETTGLFKCYKDVQLKIPVAVYVKSKSWWRFWSK